MSHRAPSPPPEPGPLRPELARLVDAGMLERARRGDGERHGEAFGELARAAELGGLVTARQAATMAALLGLAPANDW